MAAIAPLLQPKKFVAIRVARRTRFSSISGGGTTPAWAASNAIAACPAATAASWHCAATANIHATYGAAATAIVIDDGPSHDVPSASSTACIASPADPSSAASACQAAADSTSAAEPGPAQMRPELISGGNPP